MRRGILIAVALLLLSKGALAGPSLVLPANMTVLHCDMPSKDERFLGSAAPGQLFLPGEPAEVRLALPPGRCVLELQGIGTRTPGRAIDAGAGVTDTAGKAPLIELVGSPIRRPVNVTVAEQTVKVPLPERFGTYGLIVERDGQRRFLATLARVPRPRAGGTVENTPIFGEGQLLDRPDRFEERCQEQARMGIRGFRRELHWTEKQDGTYDWSQLDPLFKAAADNGLQIMATLGAHPMYFLPFGEPAPAANYSGSFAHGQADWLCAPALYPRYGAWVKAFCQRYGAPGPRPPLWGIDNYNEPWEGGGISGWARDCLQYRALQKLLATAARAVNPAIRMLAASSIMNTEDKFYSDGSTEFDRYVDIFTDHYVLPPMCYGPRVAALHGKPSMETETWFANAEYQVPQLSMQFLACGQRCLAPWHPRVVFDTVPGSDDTSFIPTPVATSTAVFNYFLTGRPFERIVFRDHLPWVFQFGRGTDAVFILCGRLGTFASANPRLRMWPQVQESDGGRFVVDNHDGLLRFFDVAGNPVHVGEKQVTLTMDTSPLYVTGGDPFDTKRPLDKAGWVAQATSRLAAGRIVGSRPVEILPHDPQAPLGPDASLDVTVHNCLPQPVRGTLSVQATPAWQLAAGTRALVLKGGESRTVSWPVLQAGPTGPYLAAFHFDSDAGAADYAEAMTSVAVPHKTIHVDGNLDDWADVPAVRLLSSDLAGASVIDNLQRPWSQVAATDKPAAEFKLAWDKDFLYVCAVVSGQSSRHVRRATLTDDWFFHTAADDSLPYYRDFLAKHPGHSFAEVPYVYAKNPGPEQAFAGDRLQIGLDVVPGWHDLTPDTDRVPFGFHAWPDTDYEYSAYLCDDGGAEVWRLLAPGVPRVHDAPRQPKGALSTGVVQAPCIIRQDGTQRIYEMAIPRSELAQFPLQAGTDFGMTLRIGYAGGTSLDYGVNKAVTNTNGLSLHPYYMSNTSCGVRWRLAP